MSDFAGNSAKLAIESIRSSRLRDHYIQITQQTSADILQEAEHAQTLSPCQRWDVWQGAARKASKLRNDHMERARRHLSPSALALSKLIKNKAPTFPEIWKRYNKQLYDSDEEEGLSYLSSDKQYAVCRAIIRASGRTNSTVNVVSKVLGCCGSVTLLVTLGLLLVSVSRADSPALYAGQCVVTIASGMLGAYAGSTSGFLAARYMQGGNLAVLVLSVAGGMTMGFAAAVLSDVIVTWVCDKPYSFRDSFVLVLR